MDSRLDQYLSVKDRLSFRAVSKAQLESARESERAPYRSKEAFVIGLSGQFYNVNDPYDFKQMWSASWNLYNETIQSFSAKPALIYKLNDIHDNEFCSKLRRFTEGEDIRDNGRRYCPGSHAWGTNEIWVLAQIHRGRSFTILSAVSAKNKKRKTRAGVYSAFTREITSAMMVGYRPSLSKHGYLSLQAPSDIVARNITIDMLRADATISEKFYQSLMAFSNDQIERDLTSFNDLYDLIQYLLPRRNKTALITKYLGQNEIARFFSSYENLIIFAKKIPEVSAIQVNNPPYILTVSPPNFSMFIELAKLYPHYFGRQLTRVIKQVTTNASNVDFLYYFPCFQALLDFAKWFPHLLDKLFQVILNDLSIFSRVIDSHFAIISIAEYCPDYLEATINVIIIDLGQFDRLISNPYALISLCDALPKHLFARLQDTFFSDFNQAFRIIKKTLDFIRIAQVFPMHSPNMLAYLLAHPNEFRRIVKDETDLKDLVEHFPDFAEVINAQYIKCRVSLIRYADLDVVLFRRCLARHQAAVMLMPSQYDVRPMNSSNIGQIRGK